MAEAAGFEPARGLVNNQVPYQLGYASSNLSFAGFGVRRRSRYLSVSILSAALWLFTRRANLGRRQSARDYAGRTPK